MHSYLRAVGFSKYTDRMEIKKMIEDTVRTPDRKHFAAHGDTAAFCQFEKCYGEDFGICVCGQYDESNVFEMDYYYPFFKGYNITTDEQPIIEKHAEKESYAGLCDDFRVGISLIFYLNNVVDYKRYMNASQTSSYMSGVTFAGLSVHGKILLPMNKTPKQKEAEREAVKQRNQLFAAAKQGDENAMQSLTLEDLDLFTMIGKRIGKEDILTIVETYFMPRGIECDQYSLLGEILDFRLEENSLTKEQIYVITVNSNDLIFDVCINKLDLLGEPQVGRRLKADIWLQGTVHFD